MLRWTFGPARSTSFSSFSAAAAPLGGWAPQSFTTPATCSTSSPARSPLEEQLAAAWPAVLAIRFARLELSLDATPGADVVPSRRFLFDRNGYFDDARVRIWRRLVTR